MKKRTYSYSCIPAMAGRESCVKIYIQIKFVLSNLLLRVVSLSDAILMQQQRYASTVSSESPNALLRPPKDREELTTWLL